MYHIKAAPVVQGEGANEWGTISRTGAYKEDIMLVKDKMCSSAKMHVV